MACVVQSAIRGTCNLYAIVRALCDSLTTLVGPRRQSSPCCAQSTSKPGRTDWHVPLLATPNRSQPQQGEVGNANGGHHAITAHPRNARLKRTVDTAQVCTAIQLQLGASAKPIHVRTATSAHWLDSFFNETVLDNLQNHAKITRKSAHQADCHVL